MLLRSIFSAALALGMAFSKAAAEPPLARTEAGSVEGVQEGDVAAYLGIPFAAPPVGDLRWRPPHPAPYWTSVRPAQHFGSDCIQNALPAPGGQPTSEDCLYLNVWTDAAAGPAKRPVMVYVYGGNFNIGSGAWTMVNGRHFAGRGVVLVTFNYRLGKLGYFAHPAIAAESGPEPLGNFGLLDQLAALHWVKRNIAGFGGDPANVTIFGESTGGNSVEYLMESPPARGLFQRAIAQSAIGALPLESFAAASASAKAAAAEWGVAGDDATALRQVPAATILGQATMTEGGAAPMIDRVLPSSPLAAFQSGAVAHVPFMIGTNSYEAGFFPDLAKGLSARMAPLWPKVESLYDGYGTYDTVMIERELLTDIMFAAPARALARAAASHGLPTYVYRFAYLRPDQRGKVPGPIHFDDVYPVFDTIETVVGPKGLLGLQPGPDTQRVVDEMQGRWVAFARTGQPGDAWPPFTVQDGKLLEFTPDGGEVVGELPTARLDFVDSLPKMAPEPAESKEVP